MNSIGLVWNSIEGDKNPQGYKTFGTPKVDFFSRF